MIPGKALDGVLGVWALRARFGVGVRCAHPNLRRRLARPCRGGPCARPHNGGHTWDLARRFLGSGAACWCWGSLRSPQPTVPCLMAAVPL